MFGTTFSSSSESLAAVDSVLTTLSQVTVTGWFLSWMAFRDGVVGVIIAREGHEAGALVVRLHKRGYQKACSLLSVPCEEDTETTAAI